MNTIKEIVETSSKNHIINDFDISKLLLEELKSKIQNNTHNYKLLIVDKVKLITPIPKGVGPMTIYSLLENIYNYYNFYKH